MLINFYDCIISLYVLFKVFIDVINIKKWYIMFCDKIEMKCVCVLD